MEQRNVGMRRSVKLGETGNGVWRSWLIMQFILARHIPVSYRYAEIARASFSLFIRAKKVNRRKLPPVDFASVQRGRTNKGNGAEQMTK